MRRLVLPAGTLVPGRLPLSAEAERHVRVLRMDDGAVMELVDGAGVRAQGELRRSGRGLTVEVSALEVVKRPSRRRLTLLQGIGKGDKLDGIVRQATELGVDRIQPVFTARAVAERSNRVERWRTIAEDAVRVSGRLFRPDVREPRPLLDCLRERGSAVGFVFVPSAGDALSTAFARVSEPDPELWAIVGPEGGLSAEEVEACVRDGFVAVHLGPLVLRTETAGPAVVALLRDRLGGFATRDGA